MQHNDRAKRDRHQGPKASVTIAGDAIQLVARTHGHARQSRTFVQHSDRAERDVTRGQQRPSPLPAMLFSLSHARVAMRGHGKSHVSVFYSV